ncbi:MAG: VTT domain-containing protein [Gammaproteobacteria bacterium]|nr:VTT domain-containing protein [Gammaproteobacteria bacterium]
MSDFVSPLLQWLNANPEWAGLATFLISAAESVAIIGTIVPGSITMTAIGTLAGAGVIPLGPTILWATLGAIVGDGISYWMGHYFKDRIKSMWPFRTNPYVLDKGEAFVHKYGVMSVFIGRFVGPVRALVPLVAGMLGMKPFQFTLANVASAIGWAPAYMLPGILLGAASLELPPDIAVHVILVFLFLLLFTILCFWLLIKLTMLLKDRINMVQTKLWRKLQNSRYLSPTTVILKHYDASKTYGQFSLALLFLLTCILLISLLTYVKLVGAQNLLVNDVTFHFFRGLSLRSAALDALMINITLLGQKNVILPIYIVVIASLILMRRVRAAAHVFLLGFLTASSVFVVKHLISIPRPWGLIQSIETFSMPSGHATAAVTTYLGLTWLLVYAIKTKFRGLLYVVPFILAMAISISRLYLGAHWFTDVLAGWLMGTAILTVVAISYQRQPERAIPSLKILFIILVTLAISFSWYHHIRFATLAQAYRQDQMPPIAVNGAEWWLRNGNLPAYQVSLFGFPSQRINLEWAGDLAEIRDSLFLAGWSKPPARNLGSTIHRITDISSTQYLPMISPQYLDNRPELILTRFLESPKRMVVIRLWDSNRYLEPTQAKLWVGTVSLVPRSYSWLYRANNRELEIDIQLIFPNPDVLKHWQWKLLETTVPVGYGSNKWVKRKVLLIKALHI